MVKNDTYNSGSKPLVGNDRPHRASGLVEVKPV
jgi:hypothetical protein